MSAPKKRPITAEDLYHFKVITSLDMDPDGKHVVFSVQRVDQKTEKKYSNLWMVSAEGGEPARFTTGDQVDAAPRCSPDGGTIAFLSNRGDEKQPQLYLIPTTGGEARQLTDLKGNFKSFDWSPDGSKIVFQFRKKDPEALEREEDPQKKELGVVSRHVKRVFYKLDGEGYKPDERYHLWVVDISSGEAKQITDGEIFDEDAPRWSPDGKHIAFLSNRAEDPDLQPDEVDLFVISPESEAIRKIDTPPGEKYLPVFSPDGKWIAYFSREGRGKWWRNMCLWVVPADGSGEARDLTGKFDFDSSNASINDLPGHVPMSPPTWSPDSEKIYFHVAQHGNSGLKVINRSGEADSLETVIGGEGVYGGYSFNREISEIACLHADMMTPLDVWLHDLSAGKSKPLTELNGELLAELDLGEVEEVWFKGSDDNDLQGWILKPPQFDERKKYPSIMEIHGGPRAQYANFFMHEFFYLAAQGYVVYFSNPRGGRGYGEEHSRAIWNAWGTVDYEDLMAWADIMEDKPYIDPERMGVTGGSYGGYMTVWIIGHTDRFKAAVTQRCVSNLLSMYGSSDMNWVFEQEFGDRKPWDDFEIYWRQSPIAYIGNAVTPTQVIHSENDLRCPIEQGEQVFVALKRLGIETEMIRFPEEPHGLSRGGRTDRRINRLEHMARWFGKYLKN